MRIVRAWTQDEEEFIRKHYQEMSDEEMANVLGRTEAGVQQHRVKLGCFRPRKGVHGEPWTDEEIKFVRDHWRKMSDAEIAKALGTRSRRAIRNLRCRYGWLPKAKIWLPHEVAFLKAHWEDMTDAELVKVLRRHSIQGIRGFRKRLRLIKNIPWTNQELEFLRNHWNKTDKEIAEALGIRTERAVCCKRGELGLLKRSPADE